MKKSIAKNNNQKIEISKIENSKIEISKNEKIEISKNENKSMDCKFFFLFKKIIFFY